MAPASRRVPAPSSLRPLCRAPPRRPRPPRPRLPGSPPGAVWGATNSQRAAWQKVRPSAPAPQAA
eukprot:11490383-Alexandrium_andersonii.AAC.1